MCKREAKEKNNLAHQYKNPWEADTVTNAQKLRSRNVNRNPVQHKSKLYDDIKNAKRKKKNEQNVKSGFSKTS